MLSSGNDFFYAHSLLDDELVQKFYASLTTQDATEVIVRKKKVPLTSKFINDLFNLPDVEEDEYYPLMNNINWDFFQQVLDVVTNLGSQWIIKKFFPISHSSTISMEQMLLLYAILTEKSINVGKTIHKEIYNCAKKKTEVLISHH
ncbi:hypothetical protein PVK06_027139 [Gossypium arboreum]|uniref:Putative plant transposon protein domain-containing protein n=1 Tax=Gossypium arboreum TaxID=29729 RepID=A0ABR0NZJ2_GOSAR|nr:hypothetical protein PVK06_027139 [Gossypium arboreum]